MDGMMNRLANCHNKYQGKYKKVLCVCSAGLLRSPTAAFVLSQEPYNFNTRAAGATKEYALVPVDRVLLEWADEIVCMESGHAGVIESLLGDTVKPVLILSVDDCYEYRNPELMEEIKSAYDRELAKLNEEPTNA
jgi:predicted protein tyrosine phosphatase